MKKGLALFRSRTTLDAIFMQLRTMEEYHGNMTDNNEKWDEFKGYLPEDERGFWMGS
jgi:hypothetical protein